MQFNNSLYFSKGFIINHLTRIFNQHSSWYGKINHVGNLRYCFHVNSLNSNEIILKDLNTKLIVRTIVRKYVSRRVMSLKLLLDKDWLFKLFKTACSVLVLLRIIMRYVFWIKTTFLNTYNVHIVRRKCVDFSQKFQVKSKKRSSS